MLIPPVLGFIADYFSLGDLPQAVAKQIKSFREWILGLIEKAFDWIIEKGKALLAAVGIGKKEKGKEKRQGKRQEVDSRRTDHFRHAGRGAHALHRDDGHRRRRDGGF